MAKKTTGKKGICPIFYEAVKIKDFGSICDVKIILM